MKTKTLKAKTRKAARTALRAGLLAAGITAIGLGLVAVAHFGGPTKPSHPRTPSVRLALPPAPPPAPPPAAVAAKPAEPPVTATPAPAVPASPSPSLPAWRKYAAVAPAFDGRPLVAVVIDDLGIDRKRSARAVALPGPLTLSWLPYAVDVGRQAAAGRAAGHEILLHTPMQPQGHENPGPNALTVDLSSEEIRRRLSADLALLPEAVGINHHRGSRFTRDRRGMEAVIEELKGRGLLFLDSRTIGGSVAADVAREDGVPFAVRDVFLDDTATVDYVRRQLAEVEAVARRRGVAVAIGHPHDGTLEALEPWLRGLAARGFVLAPISAVVRYRTEHPAIAAARG